MMDTKGTSPLTETSIPSRVSVESAVFLKIYFN